MTLATPSPSFSVVPKWSVEIKGIEYQAEIARVERFHLGTEDHGMFSLFLTFESSSWGQSLPLYSLDSYDKETKSRRGTEFGMNLIIEVVKRVGSPEEAKGKQVVVLRRIKHGDISGFATLGIDGSIGSPLIIQDLLDKYRDD